MTGGARVRRRTAGETLRELINTSCDTWQRWPPGSGGEGRGRYAEDRTIMTTTVDDARELIRTFTAELNDRNYGAVEEFFADGYDGRHDNDEPVAERLEREQERGAAFEGKHEAIDAVQVDTDWEDGVHLTVWYTVTGTHTGEFLHLPPTGTEVEFPLVRTFVVEDGRITRYRVVYTLGFLLDLGLDWERLTAEVDMATYLTSPAAAGSARAD